MIDYTISREALKRHCEATCKHFIHNPTSGTYMEHRRVLDLLEQTEWIPVSERLPELAGVYIVSKIFSDGFEIRILSDACYYDGSKCWYDNHGREYPNAKIIAWMPLPEPYNAESEDKNEKNNSNRSH